MQALQVLNPIAGLGEFASRLGLLASPLRRFIRALTIVARGLVRCLSGLAIRPWQLASPLRRLASPHMVLTQTIHARPIKQNKGTSCEGLSKRQLPPKLSVCSTEKLVIH